MRKFAILVEDQYQVLEVWYPYFRLKEAGVEAILVGSGAKRNTRARGVSRPGGTFYTKGPGKRF